MPGGRLDRFIITKALVVLCKLHANTNIFSNILAKVLPQVALFKAYFDLTVLQRSRPKIIFLRTGRELTVV